MWHYDGCLRLTRSRLALDARRRQPWGYVSHAHADHMARHEWALATPETARLYRHRLGHRLRVRELHLGTPLTFADLQLTAYPAGHCLGSSMLMADDGSTRLLYTGDFKLGPSLTARQAEIPEADVVVMECTFGKPRYRMPPRDDVIEQLLAAVRSAMNDGQTPVIHAYALGKAQEVTAILTSHGISVLQHPSIHAVTSVYREFGVDFRGLHGADASAYDGRLMEGHAVVTLPRGMKGFRLAGLGKVFSIATTGWAIDERTKYRWGVDLALPLSDHADFDELLQFVDRAAPREVYCTHGPHEFVDHLRDGGHNAHPLVPEAQQRLF